MKKWIAFMALLAVLMLAAWLMLPIPVEIDRQTSPDGRYTVVLQKDAELTPGNSIGGKVLLQLEGVTVESAEESFWYGPIGEKYLKISKDSWNVAWEEDRVTITLYGLYDPQNGTRTIAWPLQ